jgi:hypothetical protein
MSKYDKYICTELFKKHMLPGPNPAERDQIAAEGKRIYMEHVLWIDDEIIPGAYYGETTWIWPPSYPNQIPREELLKRISNQKPMFPHVHDFPELLSWWGTDPDNHEDTNTMGMLMGTEEIRLDKSWIAYIPAGMEHMPTRPGGGKLTNKPVCHWTFGPGSYTRDKDHEQKEDHSAIGKTAEPASSTASGGNSRYIVTGNSQVQKRPAYMREVDPEYMCLMAYIDKTVIPDAELGCETYWLLPGEKTKAGSILMDAHILDHGTYIVLNTMNYDDITDLCAEAELWIGGEKHIINKSFGAYIPPNVEQGPLIIRNISRQIFFMMSYPIGEGINKYRGR